MTCAARIFSQSVIGRAAVVMAGGVVSPFSRARLYAKRPPCSTIDALMGSSSFVNSEIGIASPFSMRSIRPKSVDVSRPMFCEFCL